MGEKLPEGEPEVRSYGRPGDPYESPPIPRWMQLVKEALPEQVPDPFGGRSRQLIPGFNPPPSGKEKDYPNLTSQLHAFVDQHQREQGPAGEIPPLGIGKPTGEFPVLVTVYVLQDGDPSHLEGLRGFFHREGVTSMRFAKSVVEVTLPISLLGPLSSQKGVTRVQPTHRGILHAVAGQGREAHGSPEWNLLGLTGDGIKVGILDKGFDGFSGRISNATPRELSSFRQADLVVRVAGGQETTLLAIEASWTADQRDSERAVRNARFLAEATGLPSIPVVASVRNTHEVTGLLEAGILCWGQIEELDIPAE